MPENPKKEIPLYRWIEVVVLPLVIGALLWMATGCVRTNDKPPNAKSPFSPSKAEAGDESPYKREPGLDFTGLRGVLNGKWLKIGQSWRGIEFTAKGIEENLSLGVPEPRHNGKYEMKGDLLFITDQDGHVNDYVLEFLSDSTMALHLEKRRGRRFDELAGQWQRVALPSGQEAEELATGPIADAKRQVKKIEQKVVKTESLLEATQIDRDEMVTKLRALGVNSTADLIGNLRGQRLAESIAKIGGEIEGLEKQLAFLDTELLKAKSIVRRMEREQAGLSPDEMRNLAQQLLETEERTVGIGSTPTTPLDVDVAVEKALKAKPRPKKSK